jgi:excisionase family DNA binding protein
MEIQRQTVTVEEAATILGVGRNKAYEAARSGQIPAIRIGKRLLVPLTALKRLLGTGYQAQPEKEPRRCQ